MLIIEKEINIEIEISARFVLKKTSYDGTGLQAAQGDKVTSWEINEI